MAEVPPADAPEKFYFPAGGHSLTTERWQLTFHHGALGIVARLATRKDCDDLARCLHAIRNQLPVRPA